MYRLSFMENNKQRVYLGRNLQMLLEIARDSQAKVYLFEIRERGQYRIATLADFNKSQGG